MKKIKYCVWGLGLMVAMTQVVQASVKMVENTSNYRIAELTLAPNETFSFTPAVQSTLSVIQGGTADLTRDGKTTSVTYVRGQALAQSSPPEVQAEMKNTGTTTLDLLIIALKPTS